MNTTLQKELVKQKAALLKFRLLNAYVSTSAEKTKMSLYELEQLRSFVSLSPKPSNKC
jgi:hypothetical protein